MGAMGFKSALSKKLEQRLCGGLGRLLGEIVPAVDGKAAHVHRPFAPGRERILGLGGDAAGGAPDREQGTGDLAARRARLLVMGEIGGAAGAVILAGGMDAQGIIEESVVMGERARIEGRKVLDLRSGSSARIEKVARVLADHRLG